MRRWLVHLFILYYRHGAGVARGAHNPENIRSNRVAGIVKLDAINVAQRESRLRAFYRCGAEEARGAHNSEDT
jgi:hypothetical protein